MGSIRRPCRRNRSPTYCGKCDDPIQFERVHLNVHAALAQFDEGNPGAIGRDTWRQSNAAELRDLVLAVAVVIHHPDFFCAGAIADVDNLAFSNSRNAAAEAEDDLVSKAMRDQACIVLRGIFAVLLAQYLG